MRSKILWRSMFYALTVALGLALAYDQLRFPAATKFWQINLVVLSVFVLELIINVQQHRQLFAGQIAQATVSSNRLAKLVDHFFLPILVYLSIAGFIYFNREPGIVYFVLVGAFALFTLLFANIRSFYLHYADVETLTHYVYDIIKLVLFFSALDSVFNLASGGQQGLLLLIPVLGVGLMGLLTYRYRQLHMTTLILVILLGTIVGILAITAFLFMPGMIILASLLGFVAFYFAVAILHHFIHGDLTLSITAEYIVIFVLIFLLVLGISRPV
ncbi:hypothetical protein KC640_03745 [Candidatus Dojkabacteria bacterium]|uniref:Uncharacterized protein n=1 Tax=Candidatus Dojkabacteria bacterium TaxID=2099670 RepID=A0A955KZ45_9BACT|nr:hypothetical protein [Candidatus Dojkabacteria bacterium]